MTPSVWRVLSVWPCQCSAGTLFFGLQLILRLLFCFPLTTDTSQVVNSLLGRVALLLFLLLIVFSVHAFGVDGARHVDVLGVDAALMDDVDEATLLPLALSCHVVRGASVLHSDGHCFFPF